MLRLELLAPESDSSAAALAHLLRYVVIDGLASLPLPVLAPGESTQVQLSLCLMAQGRYEFGCFAESLASVSEGVRDARVHQARPIVIEVDQ